MKRIKDNDWTDVLRDRLLEARLPLEDGWAKDGAVPGAPSFVGPETRGIPGQPAEKMGDGPDSVRFPGQWWLFAVAGAAAVLVAVLLLRPAPKPEPDRLVESPAVVPDQTETPVQDAGQAGPAVLAQGVGGLVPEGQTAKGSRTAAHRLPQDSVSVAIADSASVTPGLTRSLLVEERKEIPDRAGDDRMADGADVRPLSDLALVDLPEVQERGRRPWRGRVALRVQAATASVSASGATHFFTNKMMVESGEWLLATGNAAGLYGSFFPEGEFGDAYETTSSSEPRWVFVREVSESRIEYIEVQQAPILPVSVGISLSWPLSRSWALAAGLDYTQRYGFRTHQDVPQSLTLHYLGVPMDLQYYFNPDSRWRFYLGAGVQAAKCVYASGGQPLREPFLFSGNLSAGTDFRILPGVRIYLAPAFSTYFNRSAYINSWDEKPFFQLRAGLSFDL